MCVIGLAELGVSLPSWGVCFGPSACDFHTWVLRICILTLDTLACLWYGFHVGRKTAQLHNRPNGSCPLLSLQVLVDMGPGWLWYGSYKLMVNRLSESKTGCTSAP